MLVGERACGRVVVLLCGLFALGLLVVTSGGGGGGGGGGRSLGLGESDTVTTTATPSATGNSGHGPRDPAIGAPAVAIKGLKRAVRNDIGRPAFESNRNNRKSGGGGGGEQRPQHKPDVFPDDHYRRLVHFVQVTDVHVSMYGAPERISDFGHFINDTLLKIIKPPVVILSGDIVDSLGPTYMTSDQNLPEWITYRKILDDAKVTEKLQWLDIRGNHDNLNLASVSSNHNLYRTYSERGRRHEHSYHYVYEHGDERIAFVGIDTCMDPGSRRPFNFFGQLTPSRFEELGGLREQMGDVNYTVWFGHHPSAVVFGRNRQGLGIRGLFAHSGPYLCGHYHTIFNLVPRMYTMHENNALELELGDFKKNRKFRVLSIDHGLLNFVDVTFKEYPIILVTNPKNALFHLPGYEPLERIGNSSHIRVLVFSDEPIIEVKASIDGGDEMYLTQVDKTPLFVVAWKPILFAHGLHTIRVVAEDGQGRSASILFEFSVDGSRPSFEFMARAALFISRQVFIFLLIVIISIVIGPLVVLRMRRAGSLSSHGGGGRSTSSNAGGNGSAAVTTTPAAAAIAATASHSVSAGPTSESRRCCWIGSCRSHQLLFQLGLLASVDRLFFPLIAFPIYICFGPWFLGAIVEEHLGVCFLWGTFVDGSFIPGGIIFFYAVLLLLVYYIPFTLLLSSRVHSTYAAHFHTVSAGTSSRGTGQASLLSAGSAVSTSRCSISEQCKSSRVRGVKALLSPLLRNLRTLSLFTLVAFQLLWASWFWFAFGWIAVVFGFVPTGGLIFTGLLWRMASVLPRNLFCRSVSSFAQPSQQHNRDGGHQSRSHSSDPINNERSRGSSSPSRFGDGRVDKRTVFREDSPTEEDGRKESGLLLTPDQVKLSIKQN